MNSENTWSNEHGNWEYFAEENVFLCFSQEI